MSPCRGDDRNVCRPRYRLSIGSEGVDELDVFVAGDWFESSRSSVGRGSERQVGSMDVVWPAGSVVESGPVANSAAAVLPILNRDSPSDDSCAVLRVTQMGGEPALRDHRIAVGGRE